MSFSSRDISNLKDRLLFEAGGDVNLMEQALQNALKESRQTGQAAVDLDLLINHIRELNPRTDVLLQTGTC